MSIKIILNFEKSLMGLAGYQFGIKTYQEQVKNKIQFDDEIVIVFPENIQRIASSFIQGFFEDVVKEIGISGIEERVSIISSKKNMKESIISNLL